MKSVLKDWFVLVLHIATGFASEASIVLPDCAYLQRKPDQGNAYVAKSGNVCCMCPKGTYFNSDCSLDRPTTTDCLSCVYNTQVQTYVNFEPHIRTSCFREIACKRPFVSVGGSRFKKSRCECPVGTKRVNKHHCEKITSSPPEKHELPGYSHVSDPREKFKTTTSTRAESTYPVYTTTKAQKFNWMIPVISVLGCLVFSLVGVVLVLLYCLKKRKRMRGGSDRNTDSVPSAPGSIIAEGVKTVKCIIGDSLRSGTSRNITPADEEATKLFLNQNTSKNSSNQTEEIEMKNMAFPIHRNEVDWPTSNNQILNAPFVSSRYYNALGSSSSDGGGTSGASNNTNPPTLRSQGSSYRLSREHKEKRRIVFDKMQKEITKDDLLMLGRMLLPEARDFDDIQNAGHNMREMARKTFQRAIQIYPQLTLQKLREYVAGLGYLTEIIDDELEELHVMENNQNNQR